VARPRKEPLEKMRLKILNAARQVMIQKGYQDFRMHDVAAVANLASGTLYLYFKDKVELFAWVFIDLLDQLDKNMAEASKITDGLAALKKMAYEGLAFIDRHQNFLFQFTGEHPALLESEAGIKLRDRFIKHLKTLGQAIDRAVKGKQLRACNREFASLYFSFLLRIFMIDKILHRRKDPLVGKAEDLIDLFLNGLGRKTE